MEELTGLLSFLPIDDPSRVAEARRLAIAIAREEGLDDPLVGDAGLAATELATNLWKHAKGGELQVARLAGAAAPGVDVLAIDRGPGIVSIEDCLRDGYSSSGTSGTGLGAISRCAQMFDAYSQPGKGTVMLARISASEAVNKGDAANKGMVVGFAGRPVSGEEVSGDSWAMREAGAISLFIVADGLGHGVHASEASAEAIAAFRNSTDTDPAQVLGRVHRALRGTRGAAVAVARVDRNEHLVRYAGIGNISGIVVSPAKTQFMISHNGTAGHEAMRFQEFVYAFPETSTLIMHSDGLTTSWNLESYPGLKFRHPSVIAGTLYRDATRSRDDVCVIVARHCMG
jgi:anti-sigma regulatory factor (Ser/Thr protein kinase)